ncbi:MAG: hypothetical protein HZA50_05955 [Planctomycetes bacterium]|nr:hypothetical protein [Planctomycetota bacterium]
MKSPANESDRGKNMDAYQYCKILFLCLFSFGVFSVPLYAQKNIPTTIPVTGMRGESMSRNRVSGLAFHVEDAGWPSLMMLGHQHGLIGALAGSAKSAGGLVPVPLSYGLVRLTGKGQRISEDASEVTNTTTCSNEKGQTLRVTVTRLSPAILCEGETSEIEWFAQEENPAGSGNQNSFPPSPGSVKPLRWAAIGAEGTVAVGVLGKQPVSEMPFRDWEKRFDRPSSLLSKTVSPSFKPGAPAWLLLWYGSDSPFLTSKVPECLYSESFHPSKPLRMRTAYSADVPFLFVFEKAPQSVEWKTDKDGGHLHFSFQERMGRIVMLPLFGHDLQSAATTEKWLERFPDEIKAKCEVWMKLLGEFPVSVKEEAVFDDKADQVSITQKFGFVKVHDVGEKMSPIPPMLALARQQECPVEFSTPPTDLKCPTQFGPVMGIRGDKFTWTFKGLGKIIQHRQMIGPSNAKSADLEKELIAETDKVLSAGHLAPFLHIRQAPYLTSWGSAFWTDPSEIHYFLSEVFPLLPVKEQERLREYMKTEYAANPPEKVLRLETGNGKRREFYEVPARIAKMYETPNRIYSAEFFEETPFLYRAYGVSRYYETIEEKPSEQIVRYWRNAMQDSLAGRQWDSLGWFRGKYAWLRGQNPENNTPLYRHYQQTIRCVHRDFAGLVGYLRLCAMTGGKGESEAWGQMAKLLVLRFALARYGRYLFRSGLFQMPEDAEVWEYLRRSTDWSRPENHFEQVWEMSQHGVRLPLGLNKETGRNNPSEGVGRAQAPFFHPTFLDLVPETGNALADLGLTEDAKAYLRQWGELQTNWHVAYADNRPSGTEGAQMLACDSHSLFLAHSRIAKTPPEQLERFIHVPWAAVGDFFYMHKLAETIKAYRGVKWE